MILRWFLNTIDSMRLRRSAGFGTAVVSAVVAVVLALGVWQSPAGAQEPIGPEYFDNFTTISRPLTLPDQQSEAAAVTAIAIGQQGFPAIAYDNDGAKLALCADEICSSAVVRELSPLMVDTLAIAIDDENRPVVAVVDAITAELFLLRCESWSCDSPVETLVASGVSYPADITNPKPSLVIQASGLPAVAYPSAAGATVVSCTTAACSSPTSWSLGPETANWPPALGIDPEGLPVVAVRDDFEQRVELRRCTDTDCSGWTETAIEEDMLFPWIERRGLRVELEIDSSGNVVVLSESDNNTTGTSLWLHVCADTCTKAGRENLIYDLYGMSLALNGDLPVLAYGHEDSSGFPEVQQIACLDVLCENKSYRLLAVREYRDSGGLLSLATTGASTVVAYQDLESRELSVASCSLVPEDACLSRISTNGIEPMAAWSRWDAYGPASYEWSYDSCFNNRCEIRSVVVAAGTITSSSTWVPDDGAFVPDEAPGGYTMMNALNLAAGEAVYAWKVDYSFGPELGELLSLNADDQRAPGGFDRSIETLSFEPLYPDLATVTCLAGNGRIDVNLFNRRSYPATYRLEVGALSPRETMIEPGSWWRSPITGRADGDVSVVVRRNGTTIVDQVVTVDCDEQAAVSEPEVVIHDWCIGNRSILFAQFANPTDAPRPYVLDVARIDRPDLPSIRRSATAAPWGAAVRGVSGRLSYVGYIVRVFVADDLIHEELRYPSSCPHSTGLIQSLNDLTDPF